MDVFIVEVHSLFENKLELMLREINISKFAFT